MRARRAGIGAALLLSFVPVARGGHELPVYPSYYPHEIVITRAAPEAATAALRDGKMHAYVGEGVEFTPSPPTTVGSVASLGSFIVLRVKPGSTLADAPTACTALGAVIAAMGPSDALVVHPYPVTPYHGDYLYHWDLAAAAKARFFERARGVSAEPGVKVAAQNARLRELVRPDWRAADAEADVTLEEVDAHGLAAAAASMTNAWLGPEW